MTIDEQIQYYADLLIIQYRNKAAAQATVQSVAREALIDNLPLVLADAFNLDTAVGVQLDTIGKYAGVQRSVLTFSGGVTLSDSDFRTLIKLALLLNNSTGSLEQIDDILFQFLDQALVIFDNADMSIGYWMNARLGTIQLAEAIVGLGLLPKPMGVELSSLVYAGGLGFYGYRPYDHQPTDLFGFQTYDNAIVLQTSGHTTNGSAVVTGIASTALLAAGQMVIGAGVPVPSPNLAANRALILSVDSATQITMTKNATATATVTLTFVPFRPWLGYEDTISIPTT